jgi:hypothetical protein
VLGYRTITKFEEKDYKCPFCTRPSIAIMARSDKTLIGGGFNLSVILGCQCGFSLAVLDAEGLSSDEMAAELTSGVAYAEKKYLKLKEGIKFILSENRFIFV